MSPVTVQVCRVPYVDLTSLALSMRSSKGTCSGVQSQSQGAGQAYFVYTLTGELGMLECCMQNSRWDQNRATVANL